MSVALGVTLAAGLLLMASPWLAPRGRRPSGPRRPLLTRLLAEAGVARVTSVGFLALSAGSALAGGFVVLAVTGVPVLAFIAVAAAGAAPTGELLRRARARVRRARREWPDVIDHLAGAVRSGIALPDAVAALGANGPASFRDAFAGFDATYSRTGSFSVAADELKVRLSDPVADRIIETLRMAREVGGGELTSVLRALSSHLRADGAIRAEVEARQTGIANTAKLGVAAPWIVLVLLCTRPEAASAYATPGGVLLLVVGALVSVIAYRLMRMVARLPEEGRWFA